MVFKLRRWRISSYYNEETEAESCTLWTTVVVKLNEIDDAGTVGDLMKNTIRMEIRLPIKQFTNLTIKEIRVAAYGIAKQATKDLNECFQKNDLESLDQIETEFLNNNEFGCLEM